MKLITAALLLAILAQPAIAAEYVQPLQCAAVGISLNNPSTSATVQCPNVPPPPPSGCKQGAESDMGYTMNCAGTFKFVTGGQYVQKGPNQYGFEFTLGNNVNKWPGGPFGTSDIFQMGMHQCDVIGPFKPAPGHTINITLGQTWTPHPVTFGVGTSPCVFNNMKPGNGMVCAATNNPALKLSSNGGTTTCKLDPNTDYYFYVVGAKYSAAADAWINSFSPPTVQWALTLYSVN